MVMITPTAPVGLTDPSATLKFTIGGAESNVAMSLAQLGVRSAWWSRLGDDSLGRLVLDSVAAKQVETASVDFDPSRRTGVYFKDMVPGGPTQVLYYREGSAASAMSVSDLDALPEWQHVLHLSGITPALSAEADAFIETLLDMPREGRRRVSFDVNYRPQLWSPQEAEGRVLALAEKADIVFVGLDEARVLWGTEAAEDVRGLLPHVEQLVVKDGANDVTVFVGEAVHRVRPPRSEVVEVVGAGDAFAAGYLASEIRGYSVAQAITIGHLVATEAIQITFDVPDLPPLETLRDRAAAHWPEHWSKAPLQSRIPAKELT